MKRIETPYGLAEVEFVTGGKAFMAEFTVEGAYHARMVSGKYRGRVSIHHSEYTAFAELISGIAYTEAINLIAEASA